MNCSARAQHESASESCKCICSCSCISMCICICMWIWMLKIWIWDLGESSHRHVVFSPRVVLDLRLVGVSLEGHNLMGSTQSCCCCCSYTVAGSSCCRCCCCFCLSTHSRWTRVLRKSIHVICRSSDPSAFSSGEWHRSPRRASRCALISSVTGKPNQQQTKLYRTYA